MVGPSDLEDLTHLLPTGLGAINLADVAKEQSGQLALIKDMDPLRLATTFSGLLTVPELQSNCIRLEALVHLSLSVAKGARKPNDKLIARLFSSFGKGELGLQEDPSEDVFVSLIQTPRGDFRILEGVWESAGFHLQRVVNVLERIPDRDDYNHMREAVYALLRLSDAVCERAKLPRYQLGDEVPRDGLPPAILQSLSRIRRSVRFGEDELEELGISIDALTQFGFDPKSRPTLATEVIGHSILERAPVAYRNGEVVLLLPTAVSVAIRRYIIEEASSRGILHVLAAMNALEHAELFSDTQLLGLRSGAPIEFKQNDAGLIAGAMTTADRGLYVNFLFVADTLEGIDSDGMMGCYPGEASEALDDLIERWIDDAYNHAIAQPGFRECLTIFVGCGIGRAIAHSLPKKKRDNWQFEFIGAANLTTLSWLSGFNALSLWRLFESRKRLADLGVSLGNINGLLNIVAWARSLGGHLIPHGDLPENWSQGDGPKFVWVQQNALRNIRHEVVTHWDAHSAQDTNGHWICVHKDGQSIFDEDHARPFYVSKTGYADERWPRGLYETRTRFWWTQLLTTQNTSGHWAYQRSMMLRTWICRMPPALELALPGLPKGALLWKVEFQGELGDKEGIGKRGFITYEQALASLSVVSSDESRTVSVVATPEFEAAFFHPENIAERALIARSIEGFSKLARRELSVQDSTALLQAIVQGASARQTHAFLARRFRDFVQDSVWEAPVKMDDDDIAFIKLGLGWRKRRQDEGCDIVGKSACTAYLNATVEDLEDEVCADLRLLDRRSVLMFALQNHESAIKDRERWRRTSAAVLALHSDKEATARTIAEREFELNGVFQSSRLLIEFAICESPVTGGRTPGRLDMTKLMAKIMMIPGLGGWSAAIHWDAMEPKLRVTPLGDIHGNVSFQTDILEPYARAGADLTSQENVRDYAKNLEDRDIVETDESKTNAEFWAALEEEAGAPLDASRKFIDWLEDSGIKRKRAIFVEKRSTLLSELSAVEGIGHAAASALIEFLTFVPRPRWRNVPPGFDEKDRFPWRFRRRLTVLRKPIMQLNEGPDPDLILAPGIIRDAYAYMVGNFHRGDYPLWQLKPKMRKWAGRSRDRIGREFSTAVASKMEELGWKTDREVPVTKLLRKGFDQNYGDIDVLAWREADNRILLIECKDVQHRKIDGEIAEQLADFRGEVGTDGKPDHLLRHLRRIDICAAHSKEVAAFVGLAEHPKIEGHLVFKNPVPMKFAWDTLKAKISLHLLSELGNL